MGEGEDFRRCSAVARMERSEIRDWRRAFRYRIALRSIRATPLSSALPWAGTPHEICHTSDDLPQSGDMIRFERGQKLRA